MSNYLVPALKDKTAFIADDDDIACGLLRNVLRSLGMQVVDEARDGRDALAKIQKHKPQVICLDIEMPEMDGLAVLSKIRDDDANAIVLMISAAPTGNNVRQALSSRADGFIVKPFNAAKVAAEIERGLRRRAQEPPSAAPESSGQAPSS